MTAPALAGWYPIPGDEDSMVWWDGRAYTHRATRVASGWAVQALGPLPSATTGSGTPRPRARARRVIAWVIGLPVAVVLLVAVLGLVLMVVDPGPSGHDLVAELDRWRLPPTVVRVPHADEVQEGSPGSTVSQVTRSFRAKGVDAKTAATDLVRALRRQGYALRSSPGTNSWDGAGKTGRTRLLVAWSAGGIFARLTDAG